MKNDFNDVNAKTQVHTFCLQFKQDAEKALPGYTHCNYGYSTKFSPEMVSNTMNLSAGSFNKEIYKLETQLGLKEPIITRLDICFDLYDINYADLHQNFMLLNLMFYCYSKMKKVDLYVADNPMSNKMKTICLKSYDMEQEYYNKSDKNPNLNIPARFEYRIKRRSIPVDDVFDVKELIFVMFDDFKKRITEENYRNTLDMVNEAIFDKANTTEHFARKSDKVNFIKNSAHLIFNRSQLVNLCKELIYRPEGFSEVESDAKAENRVRNMNIKEVTIKATLKDNRKEEMFTRFNYISFAETKALVNMLFKAMLGYLKDSYKDASNAEIRNLYERVKSFVSYHEVKQIINSAD